MSSNAIPEGWYADPAKPDMERWWTGSEWTEHVRYTDKPALRPVSAPPADTSMIQIPAPESVVPLRPVHTPAYSPVGGASVATRIPTAPAGFPESTFDRFYIPMRRFEPTPRIGTPPRGRSTGRTVGIWLAVIAVVGVAAGVAAWALLLR